MPCRRSRRIPLPFVATVTIIGSQDIQRMFSRQHYFEHFMNTAERLENIRKKLSFDWTTLCRELGIKRTMLHYLRTGAQSPSMRLEKKISALEGKARLRSYPAPSPSVLVRLRFFGPHCQWSDDELAKKLSLSPDELQAVYSCKRELRSDELKRLAALEDEWNIIVPELEVPRPGSVVHEHFQGLEKTTAEPAWVIEFRGRLERIEQALGLKNKAVRSKIGGTG